MRKTPGQDGSLLPVSSFSPKLILFLVSPLFVSFATAQNTFASSRNVGIGTAVQQNRVLENLEQRIEKLEHPDKTGNK